MYKRYNTYLTLKSEIFTIYRERNIHDSTYSTQIPVITMIHPPYAPKAGGTRITIDGQNLGIGNRNISVMLGNKNCLRPEVKPDMPFQSV